MSINSAVKLGFNKNWFIFIILVFSFPSYSNDNSDYVFEYGELNSIGLDMVEVVVNTSHIYIEADKQTLFGYIVKSKNGSDFMHSAIFHTPTPKDITGTQPKGVNVDGEKTKIEYKSRLCPGYCFVVVTLTNLDPVGTYRFDVSLNEEYKYDMTFTVRNN